MMREVYIPEGCGHDDTFRDSASVKVQSRAQRKLKMRLRNVPSTAEIGRRKRTSEKKSEGTGKDGADVIQAQTGRCWCF